MKMILYMMGIFFFLCLCLFLILPICLGLMDLAVAFMLHVYDVSRQWSVEIMEMLGW